ncbi:DUF3311 domain-containing protein [Acidianus manzaensis]|uniref:DUF3311 domain-containing protein n=1 Tax=Acidianus manzaensis TaxID=282676 RepID=A0A1W6JWU9_9CREN|nr:DUF3311 domain-containing protein [Acidianus manzaensis]ARM74743.1 hypothetical protein B6F84_01025 [Acidianus manzaensis]
MRTKFYVAVFIALIVDIVLYSIFPLFNKVSPELLGLPFFYWYQTVMLVVTSAIFFGISYGVKEAE